MLPDQLRTYLVSSSSSRSSTTLLQELHGGLSQLELLDLPARRLGERVGSREEEDIFRD